MPKIIFQPLMIPNPAERLAEDVKDETSSHQNNYNTVQISQVTSGPQRGPTFNNRWWNDRRSWNLRTTNSREKASPKGANRIHSCPCSPPSGTIESVRLLSAGSIPFGHSTRGYSHSPPSGTEEKLATQNTLYESIKTTTILNF